MTDAELRDAAWEHLEQTTIGWLKPNGQPRPSPGTHWKAAKELLDQIGVTPEPEPPPSSGVFGCSLEATGLANLELGKFDREVGYRFTAARSGVISGVRCYIKYGTGYSAGDGGDIGCFLTAAGADGFPTGPSLATGIITNPLSQPFRTFPLTASLQAGKSYCITWENTASDQATNYVSLNSANRDTAFADGVFYRDGVSAWREHLTRSPIFELMYVDGSWQGQTYVDFRSSSGKVTLGSVTQTLAPTEDRTFSKVHAFVAGSGTLGFTLAGRSASVPVNGRGWASADLAVSLSAGQVYSLTLTGPGVTIFPYVKGTNYGFHNPFPEGRSNANASEDWPVYLT